MPKPTLRARVNRLLARADLEPAPWGQGAKVAGYATVAQVGVTVAPTLRAYAKACDDRAFRAKVAAIISYGGGFYWSVWPVLVPKKLPATLGRSSLVTLLAGCVTIAIDPDSGAFLIADLRTSAVASFLFDDVVESDLKPGDFVLEALSLEKFLTGYGTKKRRPRGAAIGKEIARLYRRGIWLARLLADSDRPPGLGRIAHTGRDASPLRVYQRERTQFTTHPHYALYWLLAFAVLGAKEHLADALARSATVRHPAVVAVRTLLARGGDLLAHRKRAWPARDRDAVLAVIAATTVGV